MRSKQAHGGVIFRELFDLILTQLRRNPTHAVVDIVVPIPVRESGELRE